MSNTVYRLYPEKLGDASSLTFVGNAFAPLTNTGKSPILGITTLSSAFT